ncbi:MAG: DUF2817 domain-containing protein, partial [Akkermansiaceae bacterium]|nr:DUF2817 domain-containing protein [Akkermansiaceae bacterium]
ESHFSDRDYRFATPEFGTYPELRVLRALRAENRAHHHCPPGDPRLRRARREILECFCPGAPAWRRQVVRLGLEIIERGERALLGLGIRGEHRGHQAVPPEGTRT